MSTKLSNCPHCNGAIEKESGPLNKVFRNEAKIDVLRCHHCDGLFKIDPAEYIKAKISGAKVNLYKSSELLKSEKRAGFKTVDDTIPEHVWDSKFADEIAEQTGATRKSKDDTIPEYDWDSKLDEIAEQRGINHKSKDDSMFDWSGYPIKVAIGLALFAVIIFIDKA